MKHPHVLMIAQRLSIGGVTEHIRTLGRQLVGDGWKVGLVANWNSPGGSVSREEVQADGLDTHHIGFPALGRPSPVLPFEFVRAARATRQLIRETKPDVLHVHWRTTLPYLPFAPTVPSVFSVHSLDIRGAGTGALYRIPDRFLAISRALESELSVEHHISADRIVYVPNGVEAKPPATDQERSSARAALGLSDSAFVIVTVARLETVKRHDVTIRAMAGLADDGVDARLLLVGEGTQREPLARLAEGLGVGDRVILAGHQVPEPYLCASDVFVLSSEREGFALAVSEAMMRGIAPVRTDTGGTADQIIDGQTGLITPHGDVDGLRARLLSLYRQPAERQRLAQAAALHAHETLSTGAMSDLVTKVYCDLMTS